MGLYLCLPILISAVLLLVLSFLLRLGFGGLQLGPADQVISLWEARVLKRLHKGRAGGLLTLGAGWRRASQQAEIRCGSHTDVPWRDSSGWDKANTYRFIHFCLDCLALLFLSVQHQI